MSGGWSLATPGVDDPRRRSFQSACDVTRRAVNAADIVDRASSLSDVVSRRATLWFRFYRGYAVPPLTRTSKHRKQIRTREFTNERPLVRDEFHRTRTIDETFRSRRKITRGSVRKHFKESSSIRASRLTKFVSRPFRETRWTISWKYTLVEKHNCSRFSDKKRFFCTLLPAERTIFKNNKKYFS